MERTPSSKLRFSLRMLLIAMTCVCCYTAGQLNGYRIRKAESKTSSSQAYTVAYSVPLSADIGNDAAAVSEALNDVVDRVKSGVMPAVWNETDTPFKVVPFPENQSLLLSADQSIHEGVRAFLNQARDVRLARE